MFHFLYGSYWELMGVIGSYLSVWELSGVIGSYLFCMGVICTVNSQREAFNSNYLQLSTYSFFSVNSQREVLNSCYLLLTPYSLLVLIKVSTVNPDDAS